MIGGRRRGGGLSAGRVAVRLLLAVFALRALVPLGYMPDLGAFGEGRFEIVLCTAAGTQTLLVDAEGRPVAPEKRDGTAKSSADCPFGTAITKALSLPDAVALGRLPAGPAEAPRRAADRSLAPPAQGPPLGPRAPPILLG